MLMSLLIIAILTIFLLGLGAALNHEGHKVKDYYDL